MESNTKLSAAERAIVCQWQEPSWNAITADWGQDLDGSARASRALVRGRKLKKAEDLLRMVLVYAVCDWSLRLVAAWATLQGIACLSDVALLYRFYQCGPWLGQLVAQVLARRNEWLQQLTGVRLRIVDATVISQPGSTGTDWRMHLSFDLGHMCLDGVELTDAKGGESLTRFAPRSDEIYVADRGYCASRNLSSLLRTDARLVVRINWRNLPLKTPLGERLNLINWLKTVRTIREQIVYVSTPAGDHALRLIALPLSAAQAQQARQRAAQTARRKSRTIRPETYLAAGFVLLVTNLPSQTWEASRVLYLYRLRWQIELQIKRLKSLLQFDHLRAQDPRLAQTYLLGKLLAALLLDALVQQAEQHRTAAASQSLQRPLSLWRLHALLLAGLRQEIIGCLSIRKILAALPYLQRYLCDAPRKRNQQAAWARRFLVRLSNV